eukprot:2788470-Prymnesium_polylepis.1
MRQQLNDVTQELDELNGTLAEKDAELATLTSGPRPGRPANTEEQFLQMRSEVGVYGNYVK